MTFIELYNKSAWVAVLKRLLTNGIFTTLTDGREAVLTVLADGTSLAGVWSAQTFDDVTNVLQSKDLPANVIALKATYYDIASGAGVAAAIAIDAANATAGETAIDAGLTPQIPLGNIGEWEFAASDAITRVDFKAVVAETGTTKLVLEWKV